MENAQKAIIMAGSAFMFVIAVSIAIYSYNTVIATVESILTSSEQYSQTVEGFTANEVKDVERYATREEVIMTILSMQDKDYTPTTVYVNGKEYSKTTGAELDDSLNKTYIPTGLYEISYNYDTEGNPIVTFKTKPQDD